LCPNLHTMKVYKEHGDRAAHHPNFHTTCNSYTIVTQFSRISANSSTPDLIMHELSIVISSRQNVMIITLWMSAVELGSHIFSTPCDGYTTVTDQSWIKWWCFLHNMYSGCNAVTRPSLSSGILSTLAIVVIVPRVSLLDLSKVMSFLSHCM
jgi:hypothetical protein